MKINKFQFRLSDSDLLILERMSQINSKTPSEYLRELMKLDYDNYTCFGDFIEKQNEEIKCSLYKYSLDVEKR